MKIKIVILSILNYNNTLGSQGLTINNIDHLLGRKGEREFIGKKLANKLEELFDDGYIFKNLKQYSITQKGIDFLEENKN
ncbi:hypothetical protein [Kordia jejudonensis]|uniref:hypothetical protein n=1 Tax=Kordia jejudonensis TaxID=1348245 RepID=UPI0006293EA8|nr:hypothetical protein [Kordia jejudonensis]